MDTGFHSEKHGRGERIRTSGLYVPNVALYLTKLHPDKADGHAVKLVAAFQ